LHIISITTVDRNLVQVNAMTNVGA